MAVLTPQPKMQFTTAAGVPLSGGKVYTYIAGTTTPQATFTDYTGATPNPNPVILDSRGEANIWLGGALYKFKLTDANDVEIWTVDYISAPTSSVSAVLSGNVTIDSDTPGPALKITQTGTGPVLRVQDSADPDATPFIIDNAGNVGIGTATPTAQLEATGAAKLGSLTLTGSPLPVASGGTGLATLTANNVLIGAGTGNVTFVAPGAGGNVLTSNGTLWSSQAPPAIPTAAKAILIRTISSSGTYTTPTGVTALMLFVGGSLGRGTSYGGVGGAGYAEKYISSPAASYSITIGAAGTGSGAGGTTSVDTISITGSGGVSGNTGSSGGVATGGTFNANGGAGGTGVSSNGISGGGGAGGSRAGNGFAGGNANAGFLTSGGGGGTGGAGGAGTSVPGVGGVAATTVNASAILLRGYWPAPGGPATFNAGNPGINDSPNPSPGGSGANGNTIGIYNLPMIGGNGGAGGFSTLSLPGSVVIWEFY